MTQTAVLEELRAALQAGAAEERSVTSAPTGFADLDVVLTGFDQLVREESQQQAALHYRKLAEVTNGELWSVRLQSANADAPETALFQLALSYPTGFPVLLLVGSGRYLADDAEGLVQRLKDLLQGPVPLSHFLQKVAP